SFEALVQRHEALRTTFREQSGAPTQVIHDVSARHFAIIDLRTLSTGLRSAELERVLTNEAQGPFDLARGPLLRTTLVRLAEREHVLVLVMHHIVSDGWSMGILMREMAELYSAFVDARVPALPELPVQYADYAVWQRGWLQGSTLESQLDYWKHQLAGAPRALELLTDRPRPAVQTFRGATCAVSWPLQLWEGVQSLAQREGATPYMVLLAA
ncbi:non-ribosomal peptide synthetase, partial [Myxococcaceae bacterium JPH2]|nr:non-ribosomal peptide synthetase [Myxococcaceae bacterium JPH2]